MQCLLLHVLAKSVGDEKCRHKWSCEDHVLVVSDARRHTCLGGEQPPRSVSVGRVAPIVVNSLVSSQWLPVPTYEHLLKKHVPLADTAPPYRRRPSDVECDDVDCIMTNTSSHHHHLLIDLPQRLQRSCTNNAKGIWSEYMYNVFVGDRGFNCLHKVTDLLNNPLMLSLCTVTPNSEFLY